MFVDPWLLGNNYRFPFYFGPEPRMKRVPVAAWVRRSICPLLPLQLGDMEFRLLVNLASKPYRPFSRHFIAAAVTTRRRPVADGEVDQLIATLREQPVVTGARPNYRVFMRRFENECG
jgi:DNA-binding response OmpR family regulator